MIGDGLMRWVEKAGLASLDHAVRSSCMMCTSDILIELDQFFGAHASSNCPDSTHPRHFPPFSYPDKTFVSVVTSHAPADPLLSVLALMSTFSLLPCAQR